MNGAIAPPGSLIAGGRYRIECLLRRRSRVNLYLGRRVSHTSNADGAQSDGGEALVAIRELDLSGLPHPYRHLVERAAFEEFVAPVVSGASRAPSVPDRVVDEDERQYFIMQLERAGSSTTRASHEKPLLLADLLAREQWPWWLDSERALQWSEQLCRIVARLHRLGTVACDISPASVLVDGAEDAARLPILLPSWPPPRYLWLQAAANTSDVSDPFALYSEIFPFPPATHDNPFAAPECESDEIDERADVYSLGALLYLLLTHYAPVAPWRRIDAVRVYAHAPARQRTEPLRLDEGTESLALIPPSLLNARVSSSLEHMLLRALALDPVERYPSAFAFAEAIESFENL